MKTFNSTMVASSPYSVNKYKKACLLLAAVFTGGISATTFAQTVIGRANNVNAFDANNAWTGGIAPTSSQIAGFSSVNTATSATSTIAASVNFQIAGITYTNDPGTNLTIAGNAGSSLTLGSSGINLANGSRVLTFATSAPVVLAASQTWTTGSGVANTSQIVVGSVISGSGGLTIAGTAGSPYAPVYLNALNTFTGGVVLNDGASLRLTSSAPVVSGGAVTSSSLGTGNLTINGGTIFGTGGTIVAPTTYVNADFAINHATSSLNGRLTLGGGTLDLGGGTRTVSLGRFGTSSFVLGGGQESLRFTAVTNAPTLRVTNGNLRFVRESSGTASDFVSVAFGGGSTFAAGSGFTVGQNVITTFATSGAFGAVAGDQPHVTVESGGYLNISGATTAVSPVIRSLSGAGTVLNLSTIGTPGTSTLTINSQAGDDVTFGGSIINTSTTLNATANGFMALTKTGAGIQRLSGINTYSGATTVSAGTLGLAANNSFSVNSAISLSAAAATLDMASFSAVAPSLSVVNGSTVSFNLGSAGNTDALLDITGAFTRSGAATLNIDLSGGQVGTYKLLSFASTTFTDIGQFNAMLDDGYTGSFVLNSNDLSFTFTAIPEPSSFAVLVGFAGLGVAGLRRRRRV